jgi:hypothetical protein
VINRYGISIHPLSIKFTMVLVCHIKILPAVSIHLTEAPCTETEILVRFQVLTAASMKMNAFWDTVPCSLVEVYRRFRGAYYLHHRPDDRRNKHLWKVGKILPDYTARHPRRHSSSTEILFINVSSITVYIWIFMWKLNNCIQSALAVLLSSKNDVFTLSLTR